MRRTSSRGQVSEAGEVRLGKVMEFMQLLWEIDHGLQQASRRMSHKMGVTGPQRFVLRLVSSTPGITAGELADTLRLDPSTLTGILKRLESRQLIQRRVDPEDARRLLLTLTEQGTALTAPRHGLIEGAVRRALAQLDEDKLLATEDVLETVARELHQSS